MALKVKTQSHSRVVKYTFPETFDNISGRPLVTESFFIRRSASLSEKTCSFDLFMRNFDNMFRSVILWNINEQFFVAREVLKKFEKNFCDEFKFQAYGFINSRFRY